MTNIYFGKDDLNDGNFKKYFNQNLNISDELNSFTVIVGKNGVGKSRLLKAIREYIVVDKNKYFPHTIVRRLNYGEKDDNYDPDLSDHPLVNQNILENLFDCNENNFLDLIKNNQTNTLNEEMKEIFQFFRENIIKGIELEDYCKQSSSASSPSIDKKIFLIYLEFKKYFRRQILKKICFGSIEQLLMLNLRYDHDLEEINKEIDENKRLMFKYKIFKNYHGIVEKLDINESILFKINNDDKNGIKFKQLSPGERTILHMILIVKDKKRIQLNDTGVNKINQVLLLDEPDSHCHPDLAQKLIQFIQDDLVNELKIQVIMTTHNSTTTFSVPWGHLYILENDDSNNLKLSKSNSLTVSELIATNIKYMINLKNANFEQMYYICKSFQDNMNWFEKLINFLTKNDNYSNLKNINRIKFIKDLIKTTDLGEPTINFDDKYKNLKDVKLNKYKENTNIFWPTNRNNHAWDFMIYDAKNKQLYLYDCTTYSKSKKKKEKKKNLHNKIIDELDEENAKYWRSSEKYFMISKKIDKNLTDNTLLSDLYKLKKFHIEP